MVPRRTAYHGCGLVACCATMEDSSSGTEQDSWFTSHILFLDVAVWALMLVPPTRQDVALCNAMARCLASFPWMKALQCRLHFDRECVNSFSFRSKATPPLEPTVPASMRYVPMNPCVGLQVLTLGQATAGDEIPLSSLRHRARHESAGSAAHDSDLMSVLGWLPADADDKETVLVSGQRDLVAICSGSVGWEDYYVCDTWLSQSLAVRMKGSFYLW